jgi:hypothetical protein
MQKEKAKVPKNTKQKPLDLPKSFVIGNRSRLFF